MAGEEIASLALKILGIYSFIEAIPLLQPLTMFVSTYRYLVDEEINLVSVLFGSLFPFMILTTLGLCLLYFSRRHSRFMISGDGTPAGLSALNRFDAQAIAFSAVGVAVFVLAVPKLVQIYPF